MIGDEVVAVCVLVRHAVEVVVGWGRPERLSHIVGGRAELGDQLGGAALRLVDQRDQEVLGLDGRRVTSPRVGFRPVHGSLCARCVHLAHANSSLA